MKKLILSALFLPIAGKAGFDNSNLPSESLAEVRSGKWPISLERDVEYPDTSYLLIFRDQQILTAEVLDTVLFPNREQLKYFSKALSDLKAGSNGDVATFKDFMITRADKKYDGTWYILRDRYGLTSFQRPELEIITGTINRQ